MTTDPEALVRTLWQRIWIDGDVDRLDELVADPYVRHTRDGTAAMSPAEYGRHIGAVVETYRGSEVRFDDLTVAGDRVYARLRLTGVNLTAGEELRIVWLAHYRVAAGRIAESWVLHQAGVDW